MAEVEVAAFVKAADVEEFDEDLLDKLLRGEAGEGGVEGQDDDCADAGGGEEFEALGMGVSRRGARAGRRKRSGWGSKVMTTERTPRTRASATTEERIS